MCYGIEEEQRKRQLHDQRARNSQRQSTGLYYISAQTMVIGIYLRWYK